MAPTDLLDGPPVRKRSRQEGRKWKRNLQTDAPRIEVSSTDDKAILRLMWECGDANAIQQSEVREHQRNAGRLFRSMGEWPHYLMEFPRQHSPSPAVSDNPRDEFCPSDRLIQLLADNLPKWDRETETALAEQAKSTGMLEGGLSEAEGLAYIVTRAVEGTLVDTARQSAARGLSTARLNDGRRFSSEICTELIWRLDLDSYNPSQFLDQLYNELRRFAESVPRERTWGQLTIDRGMVLQLDIDVASASAFPEWDDPDEEGWVESV